MAKIRINVYIEKSAATPPRPQKPPEVTWAAFLWRVVVKQFSVSSHGVPSSCHLLRIMVCSIYEFGTDG